MNVAKIAMISVLATGVLAAADLSVATQAKFIKMVATSAGSNNKIDCPDHAMMAELAKNGFANDPACKVAWAANEAEVRSLKGAGKLVICGKMEWLMEGGSIAVVQEGGKPSLYLDMNHITSSGVHLSDAVLKIGKRF